MFNGKITHSLFFDGHFTRVKLYNLSSSYKNSYPRLISINEKKISVTDAYFSYAPTGKAPWSSRIWEAILSLSIPVILVDAIVEPFEKWLNYKAFTIKVRAAELFWTDNLDEYNFISKIKHFSEDYEANIDNVTNIEKKLIYIISNAL